MRVNLDAAASLEVIGWLYIAAGLAASIALVVNFFTPVEQPLVAIHFGPPSINLGVLLLPIGIGLRLHGAMSRRVALALSWFIAVLLPVAAILLVVAAASGAAIESTWTPALPLGDAVSRAMHRCGRRLSMSIGRVNAAGWNGAFGD